MTLNKNIFVYLFYIFVIAYYTYQQKKILYIKIRNATKVYSRKRMSSINYYAHAVHIIAMNR